MREMHAMVNTSDARCARRRRAPTLGTPFFRIIDTGRMTQPRHPTGDPHAIRPRATPWRAAGRPNRAELQAAALDGLPLMTATLDAAATIVAVNEEWRSFARHNGIGGPTLGVG